jgi:hypothetical protein
MHFPGLTYYKDATMPVLCFLLFLCFRKVTQEIFPELDEIKAERPNIKRSFQKTEEETEPSQRMATPQGGAAQSLAAPTHGEEPLVHS